MIVARLWIDGTEYVGKGSTNNYALDALNEKWQAVCANDTNRDKRRVSQLAEHIRFVNE